MKKTVLLSCIAALVCFCIGFGAVALIGGGNAAPAEPGAAPVLTLKNQAEGISVTGRSYYPDSPALMQKLEQISCGIENGILTDATLITELEAALRELEQLGYYYDYMGSTSATGKDGTVYGASADDLGPIGGGAGYQEVYTSGDYTVTDDNSFYDAVSKAKAGDVIFVPKDVVIDLSDLKHTEYPELTIAPGVTIASDRGVDGSVGGVLKFSIFHSWMFITSDDVRITGLVLQGPDGSIHTDSANYFAIDGVMTRGKNVEIDNCELSGFSGTGLLIDSGDAYIHHCYIHHVRGIDYGHGIRVAGADARIEYNLFSNCQNAVTVGADAGTVTALGNVEVGNSLGAMFCLAAGETEAAGLPGMPHNGASVTLKNNTVLGDTLPVKLEGMPASYTVENNLFALATGQYDQTLFFGSEELRESIRLRSLFRNNAFGLEAPQVLTWNETVEQGG